MNQGRNSQNINSLQTYYQGSIVSGYEARRATQASWHEENRVFDTYLEQLDLPSGAPVLDIPIGTGRFLESFTRRGFHVIGRDISADMVATSKQRATAIGLADADIAVGDSTNIALADNSVTLVVSVRFLVHLELPVIDQILSELARVSSGHVITHVRIASPGTLNAIKRAIDCTLRKLRRVSAKKVSNKAATIHRHEDVLALFTKHGLQVLRDEITNKPKKGHESHFYLLQCS
jgi:ubiquinone/menaquinone biosynthesis C-methylase UbiE